MKQLHELIKTVDKLLIAGIGNVLKKDDGVGVYVTRNIETISTIMPLTVELSIENYIGKINELEPDVLVLVDAVEFNREAGYSKLLPLGELLDRTTHTHNISLNQLDQFFQMPVYVLGIQPRSLSFGEGLSPEVKNAADSALSIINSCKYARTHIGQ